VGKEIRIRDDQPSFELIKTEWFSPINYEVDIFEVLGCW
jgi:hypothetical protein